MKCQVKIGSRRGAGKTHHLPKAVAYGLADRPEAARKAIRAAVQTARDLAPCVPLFAGGNPSEAARRPRLKQRHPCLVSLGSSFLVFR